MDPALNSQPKKKKKKERKWLALVFTTIDQQFLFLFIIIFPVSLTGKISDG